MSKTTLSLPSRGIPYDDVDITDIVVRPYKVRDEKVLAQITAVNIERKYAQVLADVVTGIDPGRLTIGDRMYIMLWEYIHSYTDVDSTSTRCSHCMQSVVAQVDLNTLGVVYLPEDFEPVQTLSVWDPDDQPIDVKVRLLTVQDEIATEKFLVDHHDEALLYRYARSLVMEDKSARERLAWVSGCPVKTMAKIRAWHDKYDHGPDMLGKYTCSKCGKEDDAVVPFRFDFIYPEGDFISGFVG